MARRRWGLRSVMFLGGAALIMVPALVAASLYSASLQHRGEALVVERLKTRGELSANLLARRMYGVWTDVARLATIVDPTNAAEARDQIDFMSRLEQRFSWLGIADPGGIVTVAKNRMLEGDSVAQMRWFRRGLEAASAVDNHEAEALARLMPPATGPYRFIAMSAPLKHDGAVTGVIGAQVNWQWVVDSVAALNSPGIELVLLSREGVVLFGPPDLVGKPLATGSAQAAARTASAVLTERWPDGRDYFTVTIPTVGYADLPSFGWSLLIRQDAGDALAPTRQLVRAFWLTLAEGLFAVLVLLYFAAQWVATPLRRLAASAEVIVQNPYSGLLHPETRYDEAAQLRDALVRLQAKLMAKAAEPGG